LLCAQLDALYYEEKPREVGDRVHAAFPERGLKV
jgi:hypothetical protein